MENDKYKFETEFDPKMFLPSAQSNPLYDRRLSPGENYERAKRVRHCDFSMEEYLEKAVYKVSPGEYFDYIKDVYLKDVSILKDLTPVGIDKLEFIASMNKLFEDLCSDDEVDGDLIDEMFESELFMQTAHAKDLCHDSLPHVIYKAAKEYRVFKIENHKQRAMHFMLRAPTFLKTVPEEDRNPTMLFNYISQFESWLPGLIFESNKTYFERYCITKDDMTIHFNESNPCSARIAFKYRKHLIPSKRYKVVLPKEFVDIFKV